MFVLNAVDGCIPSDMATGTAARHRRRAAPALRGDDARQGSAAPDRAAALLRAPAARNGDRHVYAPRTRFIPASIAGHLEQTTWPKRRQDMPPLAASGPLASVDLKARLGGMWKAGA